MAFAIHEKDFVSAIRPCDCGKTSVSNIVAGLRQPDEGSIIYRGKQNSNLRSEVDDMLQKDLLVPWRTMLEVVLLGSEL